MKTHKPISDSSALLAGATGMGSVGAALFGVPGAVLGIVLGFGVGYWAEVETAKTNRNHNRTEQHKAHA